MADLLGKWLRKIAEVVISITTTLVFLFLDFLDFVMCILSGTLMKIMRENQPHVTVEVKNEQMAAKREKLELQIRCLGGKMFSGKLVYLELHPSKSAQILKKTRTRYLRKTRWSDCGCESCVSWMKNGDDQRLHVIVEEPSEENQDFGKTPIENVIFLHGMASSSFLWSQTVFREFGGKYRLFAVDLLGFGNSPKPRKCLYTLNDHLEMVEKSVIRDFELTSFHLVAHSMGCMIALALAAKYPNNLKSITLVAPPYFLTSEEEDASQISLNRLAYKSLWPPSLLVISFMTWYEHLGRCLYFIMCANHRTWERILNLVTRKRKMDCLVIDWARTTHNCIWHTMHNVVCGGAKMMDPCLEILRQARARVTLVHGSRDKVVPVECSHNIKIKIPDAEVKIITSADHRSVIIGREKEFVKDLERIWGTVIDSTG